MAVSRFFVGTDLGVSQAGMIVDDCVDEGSSDPRRVVIVSLPATSCGLSSVASALLATHELVPATVGDVREFRDVDMDRRAGVVMFRNGVRALL
jgi:hypothetical protein